ncbi:MAG: FGGY family carbohydrate kinase [Pseudomonadota bacterium]
MTPPSTSEVLLVGVDAGTTNTKAVVFDVAGRVVAEASQPTPIVYPRPEWAEYDGETLWQSAAVALRAALGKIEDPRRVAAVAFASMGETAVPLDGHGAATGPAIAWFDKRAEAELEHIVDAVGQDRLFAVSGLSPEPIFGLCKLLWHRRHRSEPFARTARWLNVADYLAWRLSGEMATDYSLACRTFALDLATLDWSAEVLSAVGVAPSLMAPLARSGEALGRVTTEAAAATGLPEGCVVAVGGHDHIVGALAADAMRPGVLLTSTGTTEANLIGTARPSDEPALGRAGYAQGVAYVETPVYYVIGGLFTAGGAIDWFKAHVAAGAEYATLVAEAARSPAGAQGALFLPHLRLGTAPRQNPRARGAFLGLSTDTTRGDLFRAVLEGIAADSRLCAEGMQALIPAAPPQAIRVIGGLTRNPLYMRIKAAMLGRALTEVDVVDSVAAGAALLAGLAAGIYPNQAAATDAFRSGEREIEPAPALATFYEQLYREVYVPLSPAVRPIHDALSGVLSETAGAG